jgi:alpha-galactosidase
LCIGVKEVHDYLARFIDVPADALWSAAIGVNHLTWITELRYQGYDAWPLVRQKMAEKPEVVANNPVSWDLFQVFDAFPAVLDRHVVEFFPGWHGQQGYHGRTLGVDAMRPMALSRWLKKAKPVSIPNWSRFYGRSGATPITSTRSICQIPAR